MSDLERWLTPHLLQAVYLGSHPTQAGLEVLARRFLVPSYGW